MKEWKKQFKPAVLEKGYEMVLNHQVMDVYKSDTGIDGVVHDENDYDVEVFIQEDKLINMACTCAEADDGNTCVHMAALLYAYENSDGINDYSKTAQIQYTNQEVSNIIRQMSKAELKSFLQLYVSQSKEFQFDLMIQKTNSLSKEMFNALKKQAVEIGGVGFIDYEYASEYGQNLHSFLENYAAVMIEHNCFLMAFELICEIFLNIANREMDDSSDEFGYVSSYCYELWKSIAERCSVFEKNTMRIWFKENTQGQLIDYAEDVLTSFSELELNYKTLLCKRLSECDSMIKRAGQNPECGHLYTEYGETNVILRRIDTMVKLGCSKETIETYKKNHRQFYVIRELEIQDALNRSDESKLFELLLESKKLDKGIETQMRKYHQMLIEYYQRHQMSESLVKECREYLYNLYQYDLYAVKKLKEHLSASEWEKEFLYLCHCPTMKPVYYDLLEFEGKYSDMISEMKTLSELDRFRDALMKHDEEACCRKYTVLLNQEAEYSAGRKHYIQLCRYLLMLCRYKTGKGCTASLVNLWKQKYPRRTAMLQELRNSGF